MLVVSRKRGQGIILGDGEIEITVLRVEGEQVRLGIKAPREIQVVRRELLDDVRSETEKAPTRAPNQDDAAEALRRISRVFRKPKAQ